MNEIAIWQPPVESPFTWINTQFPEPPKKIIRRSGFGFARYGSAKYTVDEHGTEMKRALENCI